MGFWRMSAPGRTVVGAVRGLLPRRSLHPILLFQGYHRSNHFIATQGTWPLCLWRPLVTWNVCCLPAFPADLLSILLPPSASPSVCLSAPTTCVDLLHLTTALIHPVCLCLLRWSVPPPECGCVFLCGNACARTGAVPTVMEHASWSSWPPGSPLALSLFCYCLSVHLCCPRPEGLSSTQLIRSYSSHQALQPGSALLLPIPGPCRREAMVGGVY